MIGIKGMEMPCDCWSCGFTYDDFNGMTTCSLTRMPLYPMGSKNKREDDCKKAIKRMTEALGKEPEKKRKKFW